MTTIDSVSLLNRMLPNKDNISSVVNPNCAKIVMFYIVALWHPYILITSSSMFFYEIILLLVFQYILSFCVFMHLFGRPFVKHG